MLDKFRIGHYQEDNIGSGVSVVICDEGAIGGVSVRGSAPATRETDLLKSENSVDKVNAIFLSGGSAFGLDVATGIMQYLSENNIGFKTSAKLVPIVCGACIYDLEYKSNQAPTAEFGYKACLNSVANNYAYGNIGAGCGATVGKLLGASNSSKAGLGVSTFTSNGLEVLVIVVVNAFGDVYNYKNGDMIKGITNVNGMNTLDLMRNFDASNVGKNTTIGCVVTNAKLTKAEANKLADIAHDGYAMSIRPVHTMVDGDAIFVLASNDVECNFMQLSCLVPTLVAEAIAKAVE